MSPDRRQRLWFVTLALCLVAAFLLVVRAPLVAWTIWVASVGFCAVMIGAHNPPRGSGRR
jgi:uncharacterized membrane protein HdeD (DUF308 family)